MHTNDHTTSGSRPVTLDFATDETLNASVDGLEPEDRANLAALFASRAVIDADRALIDAVRVNLAEEAPGRAAIGVLFAIAGENSDGCSLSSDGEVLFADRDTEFFTFDDAVAEVLHETWPNVGRNAVVAVDVRREGTVQFAHTDRDIYSMFNTAPPTT